MNTYPSNEVKAVIESARAAGCENADQINGFLAEKVVRMEIELKAAEEAVAQTDRFLDQAQSRAEDAERKQREFFDQMNRINTWYNELLAVIYGEEPHGINERPDPRVMVENMRTEIAAKKKDSEGWHNAVKAFDGALCALAKDGTIELKESHASTVFAMGKALIDLREEIRNWGIDMQQNAVADLRRKLDEITKRVGRVADHYSNQAKRAESYIQTEPGPMFGYGEMRTIPENIAAKEAVVASNIHWRGTVQSYRQTESEIRSIIPSDAIPNPE